MGALATLRASGLHVEILPEGRLRVTPAERLTDELRALIREHKTNIMAELAAAPIAVPTAEASVTLPMGTNPRAYFRAATAVLLAELDALPELSQEQEDEAAYYRSVVSPRQRVAGLQTPARHGGVT
jgi:hypothetical protein